MSEITLITHGNLYLKENYDISSLDLNNPAFRFDNKVQFVILKKVLLLKAKWIVYAANPIDWLSALKKDKCLGLRLFYQPDNSQAPDYKLAGFVGGGGSKYIETVFDNYSDYWILKQEVTQKDNPNKKIWTKTFGKVNSKQPSQLDKYYDLNEHKDKFSLTLKRISDFAKREKLTNWAKIFDKANRLLTDDKSYQNEIQFGLIPFDNVPLDILRIYAASNKSFVFGGMGSWNDLGFSDNEKNNQYEALSKELYNIINESYLLVANMTYKY
jgi:hypothetical protein